MFSARFSLLVQWLRLCTSNAESIGSIPSWGTKIPQGATKKIYIYGSYHSGWHIRAM